VDLLEDTEGLEPCDKDGLKAPEGSNRVNLPGTRVDLAGGFGTGGFGLFGTGGPSDTVLLSLPTFVETESNGDVSIEEPAVSVSWVSTPVPG